MKGKMSLLTRKIFASIVAISMSIPPTAFASAPEPVVYDANSSIMGLAPKKEDQAKVENTDQTKIEKDLGDYSLEITSTLDESLTKIDYTIKAKRKNQAKNENSNQVSDENLSLTIAKTPTSNIKDIKLISASVDTEEAPEIKGDLNSLTLKSKANDEIIYKLRADVRKAKDGRSYELIMGLKEDATNIFSYNLKAETGIRLVDNEEVQTIELINKDEKLSKAKGDYKKEGILGGLFASHDTITWTDYIVNEEENNKEITYNFDLDQNQETANSQIGLDYYEQSENGFEIKREFSQKIDFSKKVKFEIPKGFIAKLSLQTKVSKKNTKIKSYSLNNSRLKNPIYIEGNEEEKSNDEEDPLPAEKTPTEKPVEKPAEEKKPSTEIKVDGKTTENKTPEKSAEDKNKTAEIKDKTSDQDKKTSETEILIKDANGNEVPVEKSEEKNQKQENEKPKLSALQLNKDGLISKLQSEGKLNENTKSAVEELANKLESYNEGKIIHQEILDFIKSIAQRYSIEKSDLRSYIDYILSGLNQEANPAARLDTDEIIRYAYPEKKESQIKVDDKESEEKAKGDKENPEKPSIGDKKDSTIGESHPQKTEEIKTEDSSKTQKTNDNKLNKSEELKPKQEENKSIIDNIKDGFKNILGTKDQKSMTDLEKADKELKEALAKAKDIYEVQDVLNNIGEKYKLSQEDKEKLMRDNDPKIKSLVEKTRNGNSIFRIFRAADPLEGAKFNLKTVYNTSNSFGPIQVGQFFDIKLDPKLTVYDIRTLPDIKHPRTGEVIATPTYNPTTNTIRYKVVKRISDNLSLQLNIPVDYNVDYIRNKANIPQDQGFEVENFVSGFGVTEAKSIGKFKVDKNGNIAGSIIEPGKENNYQFFENGANYRVEMQANSSPIVENGKLTAIDWTVSFFSSHDLSSKEMDLRTNFTIVDGSGLDKIEQVYLNGEPITTTDNNMGDKFLIKDSKHHKADKPSREYTYTFRTPVAEPQSFYSLDISAMLKGSLIHTEKNRIGATRLITQGYPEERLTTLTPNRAAANNRTTIKGEFFNEKTMIWKITDEVSSGDDGKLPLARRFPEGNHGKINNKPVKAAFYGLDSDGKMIKKGSNYNLSTLPDQEAYPTPEQQAGTIAVYQLETTKGIGQENTYSLGGVNISLYQDLKAKMTWEVRGLMDNPPDSNLEIQAGNETFRQTVTVPYNKNGDLYEKDFTLEGIRLFNVNNGKVEKISPIFSQTFDPEKITVGNKDYTFAQRSVFYNDYTKTYEIQNMVREKNNKKNGSFTIKKVDENGKPLAGAEFSLLSTGRDQDTRHNITTGEDGRVLVSDVAPGSYTLVETKAPIGYELNGETKTVTINDAGETNKQPTYPTAYRQNEGDDGHFMNAMDYAKVSDDKRRVDYYVFLKAKADADGKSTNRNTRFFAKIADAATGQSIGMGNAVIYNVNKDQRDALKKAMEDQTADLAISNLGLTEANNDYMAEGDKIKNESYVNDPYISLSPKNWGPGVKITFPKARFKDSWGYLIKIPATIGQARTINPKYSWHCDFFDISDVEKNWKLQREDLQIDINNTEKTEDVVEVVNKKYPSQDIIIQKEDRFENDLLGAEFSLYKLDDKNPQENGKFLTRGKTDKDGVLNLGKWSPGKYELIETRPPDGYYAPPIHYHVTVEENGTIKFEGRNKEEEIVDPGNLYWIEQRLVNDPLTIKPKITVDKENTKITLVENGTGKRARIWEGFEFETFKFEAKITVQAARTGQTVDIQLDRRWDLARLATNDIPNIIDKKTGDVVAKPYLNKKTNLITYVLTEKANGNTINMDVNITGLYPSPYEATTNNKTYTFKNTINPSGSTDPGADNQRYDFDTNFTADYGEYVFRWVDSRDKPRSQSTSPAYGIALTDTRVNEKGVPTEARGVIYYNPYASVKADSTNTFNIDWVSVDNGLSASPSARTRYGRPMDLKKVRIYKVTRLDNTNDEYDGTHTSLMPHSMGVDPSQDPANYELVGDFDINKERVTDNQGSVGIQYDKNVQYSGTLLGSGTQKAPLKISLPRVSKREGYVIETFFDVTNVRLYQDYYRQFSIEQFGGEKMTRFYTQKSGSSSAISDQVQVDVPKIYTQILGVKNTRYNTGNFELTKIDQITRKSIDGVVFILKNEEDNTQIVKATDEFGKIYFDKLKPGKYILEETQPKKGYAEEYRRWSVEVDTAGNTTITQLSFSHTDPIYDGKLTVENKTIDGEFKIFKKDENDQPLGGATFKITKIVKEGEQGFEKEATSQASDGQVKFEDIKEGEYYLVETKAPDVYQKSSKKWKLEVSRENGKLKAKIYEVRGKKTIDGNSEYGLLEGMQKVDVYSRATSDWKADDNRRTDYHGKSRTPYKLGAKIVGVNKKTNEFVTRFVINPQGESLTTNLSASIYRERPGHSNMTWYDGDGALDKSTIRIYSLNKNVTGSVHQVDLNDTTATDVTKLFIGSKIKPKDNEPHRLKISLLTAEEEIKERQGKLSAEQKNALNNKLKQITNKPLIVEVKTSYNEPYGEIGLGMDLEMEYGIYWKSDYYEDARGVVEAKESDSKDILAYIGEDTLIVNNDRKKAKFKITKLSKESKNPIEGATFNLKNKDANTPAYDQTTQSDKNGNLAFDKLVAGTYTLTETEPAPGYEKQNTTWTLKVSEDLSSQDGFKMELTADNGEEPGPQPPEPEPEKPDQTELNKIGITVDYNVELDPTIDEVQKIGVNVKNLDPRYTRIYLKDANGVDYDVEIESGTLNDANLGVRNLSVKNAKGPLTLTIKDNRLTKDFIYNINFKGQTPQPPTPPEEKKLVLEDRRTVGQSVDPNNQLQGTGIFALNRAPTSITAKDEDGESVPWYRDPSTGEIKLKPPTNVDGPITLVIGDGDLAQGSRQFTVKVTGHSKDIDDNKSNYIEVRKDSTGDLEASNSSQKTPYRLINPDGHRRDITMVDEDNDPNKFRESYGANYPNTFYVDKDGYVHVNPGTNVDGPIKMTITSDYLKSGNKSDTYDIGIKGHRANVDDNDSIPRIHIQKVYDFELPLDGNTYDTGYYLRDFVGKDYSIDYYDGDGKPLKGRVDSNGQINVQTKRLINGPIRIVLRSNDIKTGSQEEIVKLVKSSLYGPADPNYQVPRNDDYDWPIGYSIVNRKKSDKVEIVDETGKPVNAGIADDNRIYLVRPVSKLDGPLRMTVYSEGRPIASNIIINMQGQKNGHPDIEQTYRYEVLGNMAEGEIRNHTASGWGPTFMNMRSSVLNVEDLKNGSVLLKARLYLNAYQRPNRTGVGDYGKGPDKETYLNINYNGGTVKNLQIYDVNNYNKDKYVYKDVDLSQFPKGVTLSNSHTENNHTKIKLLPPDVYENQKVLNNRWGGYAVAIDFEIEYPADALNKSINWDWKNTTDSTHLDGVIGVNKVPDTTGARSARLYSVRSMDTRSAFVANDRSAVAAIDTSSPRLMMANSNAFVNTNDNLDFSPSIINQAVGLTYMARSASFDQGQAKPTSLSQPSSLQARESDLAPQGSTGTDSRFSFDISSKTATIYNKQVGVELVINKKDYFGDALADAQFTIERLAKYDPATKKYIDDNPRVQIKPENPSTIPGVADNVFVTDKQGHINIKNLVPGKYELTEVNPPKGYRKPKNPWLIEVKEKNGKLVIEQTPPGKTKESFIDEMSAATIKPGGPTTTASKILSYKLISIDPEKRSFVYRFFINPEGIKNDMEYSFDFKPGGNRFIFDDEAKAGKQGIMLNYRSTYRVKNPAKYKNKPLNTLNLKNPDVDLINTARFRPFRYGFTQDLINIKNTGVNNGDAVGYIIDLEGSYTENALAEKDEKLQLDFWFGTIERPENSSVTGKDPVTGKETFTVTKGDGHKIGHEVENLAGTDNSDQYVVKPWNKEFWGSQSTGEGQWKNTADGQPKIYHITTDLKPLFQAQSSQPVGQDGLDIFNKDKTYNMAFTKYDADAHDNSGGKTVKRLEGAVFQLQKYELGEYKDMQGYALATAFNGFVGYNNLSPGDYQIIEIKPPKGIDPKTGKEIHYRKIEGPVMRFRLEHGNGKTVNINGTDYTRQGKYTLTYRHPMFIANQEVIEEKSGLNKKGDVTNPEGQIPDYVTHATQHFGKVLNNPAGQGKIEVNKTGDDGKPLNGAKFKITRISALGNKDEKDKEIIVAEEQETKTVKIDSDGKIMANYKYTEGDENNLTTGQEIKHGFVRFDELPVGNYILEEILAPDGYRKSNEIRKFTVGGKGFDPYYEIPESTSKSTDLSSYIKYDKQTSYHVNDLEHPLGDPNAKYNYVDPNNKESLVLVNKFTLNKDKLKTDKKTINPGDYFTVKVSENLDLQGIDTRAPGGLNIIEDGVGTIAHAKYDRNTNTVKYTFTGFAQSYELEKFFATINAYIDKDKVRNDGKETYTITLGQSDSKSGNVDVKYSIAEGKQVNDFSHYTIATGWYWDGYKYVYGTYKQSTGVTDHDDMAIATKLAKYNPETGEFTQYFYINRNPNNTAHNLKFGFVPNRKVTDATFEYYKIDEKDKASKMLNSWGIDFSSLGKPEMKDDHITVQAVNGEPKGNINTGYLKDLKSIGDKASKVGYIIRVSGRVDDTNKEHFKPYGTLERRYNTYGDYIFAHAWNEARFNINDMKAQVNFSVDMPNKKNRIDFIKTDQFSRNVEGATFSLHTVERDNKGDVVSSTIYKDSSRDNTKDPTSLGSDGKMKSDKDGRIHIEGLPTGKYGIKEEPLADYEKPAEWIAFFEVNQDGQIVNVTTNAEKDNIGENGLPKPVGEGKDVEDLNQTYKLVNTKKFKYRIKKVSTEADETGKKKPLEGAVFELLYREKETDEKGQEVPWTNVKEYKIVDGKVVLEKNKPEEINVERTSGKDGIVEFEFTKPGYYAIKETKAPTGYMKKDKDGGIVKKFALIDGELVTDDAPVINTFVSKVDVNKTKSWVYTWGFVNAYDTDIKMQFNTLNMPVTYSKGKASLTISGIPKKSQPTGDKVSDQGITIYAYLTDTNGKAKSKSYDLSLSEYNNKEYTSKIIDLYELVKELEGKTDDVDITSSKSLLITMNSKLYPSTELDIGYDIKIGEAGKENTIADQKTYHIGTKGDAMENHSYSFSNEVQIGNDDSTKAKDIPEVENTKLLNFKFRKVDAKVNEETGEKDPLPGAEFDLLYREKETEKWTTINLYTKGEGEKTERFWQYASEEVPDGFTKFGKFTSPKDGVVEFKDLEKPGFYAVKETRAPAGFSLPLTKDNIVKTFEIKDGKLYLTENGKSYEQRDDGYFYGKLDKNSNKLIMRTTKASDKYNQIVYTWYINDNFNEVLFKDPKLYIDQKALGSGGTLKVTYTNGDTTKTETLLGNPLKDGWLNLSSYLTRTEKGLSKTKTSLAVSYTATMPEADKEVEAKSELTGLGDIDLVLEDKFKYDSTTKKYVDIESYARYVDANLKSTDKEGNLEVENRKVELPKALGTGNILTYTLAGLAVMLAGVFVYFKKKQAIEA